jgi:multisubunit Na+/H+ antiporter MnhF subunit
MTIWEIAVLALSVVGLVPGLVRAAIGDSRQRLVGLQLMSVVLIMIVIALAMAAQQGSYLIVAVVLALLSSAGTLVFTRLLRPDADDGSGDERVGENSD